MKDNLLLRHTPAEIQDRSALTINPAKTCQPIGALYAHPPLSGTGNGGNFLVYRRGQYFWRAGEPGPGDRYHIQTLRP